LLAFGYLRCLGHGIVFDDFKKSTTIVEETNQVFFHVFVQWVHAVLFPLHVNMMPRIAEEHKTQQVEFTTERLSGAGFSNENCNSSL